VSKKQHDKQVQRARQKRRTSAAEARQRRIRVIAIVLVAAMALALVGVAILSQFADEPGTPEITGFADDGATEPGDDAEAPAGTETPAEDPPAAAGAGYEDPQGAEVEPCPTDVDAPEPAAEPYASAPDMVIEPSGTYTATIATTCGDIVLQLDAEAAPTAVNNFVVLARDDYYVGVPFHRVIDGFMIQGGDPTGTGHGGQGRFPGYTFQDELERARELVAEHGGYPRGTLAMANAGPDTNGSQFFIVQAEPGYPLDPAYTFFGQVLEGMDVVDRIAQGPEEGGIATDPVRIIDIAIEDTPEG
jgi:cyclophilin family peptidyl-prolyl cis-trans isomerase